MIEWIMGGYGLNSKKVLISLTGKKLGIEPQHSIGMTMRYSAFCWWLDFKWAIGSTSLELRGEIWGRYRISLIIQKLIFFFKLELFFWLFSKPMNFNILLGLPITLVPGNRTPRSSSPSLFSYMKVFFSSLLLWSKTKANQISEFLASTSENKASSLNGSTVHLQFHSSP